MADTQAPPIPTPVFLSPQEQIQALFDRIRNADKVVWGIVALAAFLRLLLLGMKPPHFDEGINGWFVDQLIKNHYYRYDPTNYHGPLHFYILFVFKMLFGRNLWALRMPIVIVSTVSVWLTLKFEPFVGRNVARIAAIAMAVSPAFVFYGRYSIHEAWMLLFSMMFIFGLLGLWKFGTRGYLWCLSMGLTGMILTKETYILHVGCALIAIPVLYVLNRLKPVPDKKFATPAWDLIDLLFVVSVGVILIIFFYSGTFLHWNGVKGLYQCFSAWAATGAEGHGHDKPWYYWLKLIVRYEWPVLAGLLAAFLVDRYNLSVRYLAIYGVGTLMAYSIVNYKTPWCIISIVWPLLFVFGAGIDWLGQFWDTRKAQIVAGLLLLESLGHSIYLNYFDCTTESEPYVYVQTFNDIRVLEKPVLALAHRDPAFYSMVGHIIRTSSYPLPWILGDFPNVGYYEHNNAPPNFDADFLLVQQDRIKEVEEKLQKTYYTEPMTIRAFQEPSKAYFEAKRFKEFFHGRAPDFVGKPPGASPSPTPSPGPG